MSHEETVLDSTLCLSEAMENLDGDAELLQEIMEIFMETGDEQMSILTTCLQNGDLDQVALQAHAMKGGASNVCARDFVASALELEMLAKSGTLDGGPELLVRMAQKFGELKEVSQVINWDEVARDWQG